VARGERAYPKAHRRQEPGDKVGQQQGRRGQSNSEIVLKQPLGFSPYLLQVHDVKSVMFGVSGAEPVDSEASAQSRESALLEAPSAPVALERAAAYLRNLPRLYRDASPDLKRRSLQTLCVQMRIREKQIAAVEPKHQYLPLICLSSYGALGGTRTHDLSLRRAALYPN
jgi:hypothetical protein